MTRAVLSGFVLALLTATTQAQSLEALFVEANEAAFARRYDEAIAKYERLIEAGVQDADVEFNLGTVHAQAGHLGAAIRHFERALRIRPGDEEAQRSLDAARRLLGERRARLEGEAVLDTGGGFGAALARPFTEAGLAWALLALEALSILGFVAVLRSPAGSARRMGAGLVTVALLLGFSFTGLALGAERGAFRDGRDAVVLRDRVSLREGPDPRAASRGEAREGDWALILAEEDGYVRIRTAGREGWVERDAVGPI